MEKHIPTYDSFEKGLEGLINEGINKQTNILATNSPTPLKKGIIGFLIPCKEERDNCKRP